jgi:hypothetical protein
MRERACSLLATLAIACAPRIGPSDAPPSRHVPALMKVDADVVGRCVRTAAVLADDAPPQPLEPIDESEVERLLEDVPPGVRRTAAAAQLEPLLAELLRARQHSGGATSLEQLAVRQQIALRLAELRGQLEALMFEVECTVDHLETLLFDLEHRQHQRELAFTIASLVISAAAATAAGAWAVRDTSSPGPAVIGIGGGVLGAALGAAAFIPPRRRVSFPHARNLLAPVYEGEDRDHLYPGFVFRLLALPKAGGGPTPRDELVARWHDTLDAAVRKADRDRADDLLYGTGGIYDIELLELRERAFSELESKLNDLTRDLELFARYLGDMREPPQSAESAEHEPTAVDVDDQ